MNTEMTTSPTTSLRIQSVLYCPEVGALDRLVRGMHGSLGVALHEHAFDRVTVSLGDCSPHPSLTGEIIEDYNLQLKSAGAESSLDYTFFNENLGSAGGHNRLLADNADDFVLFLNPDVFLSPHTVVELLLPFSDARVGIVEARQIPLEHPKDFNRQFGDTSWASTAGALVRRAVLDATAGFDATSFFLYCDDVDFSWRARLAGFRIIYQPAARIYHDKRLTNDGKMIVGDAEHYYAAEAALMLSWKYSRPDLTEEWLDGLTRSEFVPHNNAAAEFRRRRQHDELPTPLDPEGSVAEFFGYDFGSYRFSYDD